MAPEHPTEARGAGRTSDGSGSRFSTAVGVDRSGAPDGRPPRRPDRRGADGPGRPAVGRVRRRG